MSLKIKVCGMKDLDNMLDLIKLPIDYMGLIFYENQNDMSVLWMPIL